MKKGQAMMEFLLTYGWAIIVVACALGSLFYFGAIGADRLLTPPEDKYNCSVIINASDVRGANDCFGNEMYNRYLHYNYSGDVCVLYSEGTKKLICNYDINGTRI